VALGASRSSIVRLVTSHGIEFVAIGLAAGVAMAIVATRLISTMLFGVDAADSTIIATSALVVGCISAIACAAPAARASRVVIAVLKSE
jgi:ABC-type antimicrobial peptide transport system permease subunit